MCFALILSLIYLIVNAGRGAIITFLFCIIFINTSIFNKKIKITTWIFMFAVVLLGVNYLRPLLYSLSALSHGVKAFYKDFITSINSTTSTTFTFSNLIYRLCYYLEHKYISLEISIKTISEGKYFYNFFIDIIVAMLALFPSSLLPFKKPIPISEHNTEFITVNAPYNTGTIPPGGIAFGYYALGWLGVVLFAFFVGQLARRLIKFFDSFGESAYIRGIKFVTMFIWIELYTNGDLRQFFLRNLPFLIMLIVIKFARKRRSVYVKKSTKQI